MPEEWDSEPLRQGQALILIGHVLLLQGGALNLAELQFLIHQMGIIFGLPSWEEKFQAKMK